MEKVAIGSFLLEKDEYGNIVAISQHLGRGMRLMLGDEVVSNGRSNLVAEGVHGIVVKIFEPAKNGLTSDVIRVQFLNDPKNIGPIRMKMPELKIPKKKSAPKFMIISQNN